MGFYGDSGGGDSRAQYEKALNEVVSNAAVDWAMRGLDRDGVAGETYNDILGLNNETLAALGTHKEIFNNYEALEAILETPAALLWFEESPFIEGVLYDSFMAPYVLYRREDLYDDYAEFEMWVRYLDNAAISDKILVKGLVAASGETAAIADGFESFDDLIDEPEILKNIIENDDAFGYMRHQDRSVMQVLKTIPKTMDYGLIGAAYINEWLKKVAEFLDAWPQFVTDVNTYASNRPSMTMAIAGLEPTGNESISDMVNNPTTMQAVADSLEACIYLYKDIDIMRAVEASSVAKTAFGNSARLETVTYTVRTNYDDTVVNKNLFVVSMNQTTRQEANYQINLLSSTVDGRQISGTFAQTYAANYPVNCFFPALKTRCTGANISVLFKYVRCQV